MNFDAVILDVDGTLWDSTPVVADVWTRAVQESGFDGWTITGDDLKQYFGKTMDVIAREMLPEATAEQQKSVMDKCCAYEHEGLKATDLDLCYPMVRETIKALSERVPVCIVSNCQAGYIELFMDKNNVTEYITDTLCFGDNDHGKADNLRILSDRNGFKNPVYVGDTAGDLAACEEAGIPMIWAAYGFGAVDEDRIAGEINSFSELTDLLIE